MNNPQTIRQIIAPYLMERHNNIRNTILRYKELDAPNIIIEMMEQKADKAKTFGGESKFKKFLDEVPKSSWIYYKIFNGPYPTKSKALSLEVNELKLVWIPEKYVLTTYNPEYCY